MYAAVTEDFKGSGCEERVNESTGRVEGTKTRAFDVQFSDGASDLYYAKDLLALSAPGIPQPWEVLPNYPWIYVVSRKADQVGPAHVRVSCGYKVFEDPLAVPPVIRWNFATESDVFERDADDKDVLNSAGEPPDPPMMKDYRDLLLQITVNRAEFDHGLAAKYIDAVNSDTFFGFPAGKVKCRAFNGDLQRVAAMQFWVHNYEFQIRTFASDPINVGWKRRMLDQGLRQLVDVDPVVIDGKTYTKELQAIGDWLVEYDDETGEEAKRTFKPISKPVALDLNGRRLADNEPKKFIEFRDYDELPFSVLGLE